jgi:hypothetical protein
MSSIMKSTSLEKNKSYKTRPLDKIMGISFGWIAITTGGNGVYS